MRLIARFCIENSDNFEIVTVYDKTIERTVTDKQKPSVTTISDRYPTAVWFERKMHDDFGISIEGAFDTRPLNRHERFPDVHPLRKSFHESDLRPVPFHPYPYEAIKGESVFEVAVGPIHAGIIEPGHFQFSQSGEGMLHLEVRHFYKYRGIERMLEGKSLKKSSKIIGRISGNESVAYQIARIKIMLEASGRPYPIELQKYHALLLETERIIHHLTDLGFIPNDAGFGAALAYASRLAEESRRFLKKLCGHRFGFDAVGWETPAYRPDEIRTFTKKLQKEIDWFEVWITDIPSLWDRFDKTGILTRAKAKKYGCVGVVARASGLQTDSRQEPFYQNHGFHIATEKSGDVAARFKVRIEEIKTSLKLIEAFTGDGTPFTMEQPSKSDYRDGDYMSFAESSIGELFMFMRLKKGKIERFFVRDPSFINWQALHLMMPGNIIADFPLINKSCDLSYAGNDL